MNDFTAAAELLKQQHTGAVSPLARAAETMKAQQAGQVGMALTYDERDPDAEAKSRQVGAALGINPVVVGADPEAYDLQLRMKQAADGLRRAPKTAAWLADRENGVLAKDDLDNLTWWERVLNAPSQGLVEMGDAAEGSAAGRMIERGVRRIPMAGDVLSVQGTSARIADVGRSLDDLIAEELAQVGGDSAPAPMRSMALMAAQVRFDAARDLSPEDVRRLLDRGSAALLSARERSDKIASIPMSGPATAFRDETLANAEDTFLGALGAFASDPIRGAAFAAEVAGEFLPAILGASAVTVVTRSPAAGALTLGTVSGLTENAASTMEFLAERGVRMETPEDAMAALQDADLMQAARDRGLTRGLVIGMMDAISGGVAGKTLMKSPAGDMIAQGLAQVGLGGGGEALGQLASGQNVSWKDIVIEGLAELVTAPIEVIGVGGRRLLRGAVKAGTAGETAETLAEADAQAAASRLKVRAPEKFREALEAQGLGDKTIHVPADALREYFQAKDVAFDEDTMRAWGIDPVTFDEAAQSGNAVAVPMSNYATYIAGTDAAAWFAENATTDPEELSLAEVRAFNMRVQDIMQDAFEEAEAARLDQDATRAADVQIYDDMFSQLREAGRSPDAARQEATMWAAFWRTMGERYGEDPLDMSRDMPVRVRGPQSPEFRRRDALDIALNTLRTKGTKALQPRGMSLAEFVKSKGGIQDAGGDVAAMEPPKGVVAETSKEIRARQSQPTLDAMPATGKGMSLDDMGRMAAEAGYFPDLMGEVNAATNKGEATDFAARLLEALSEDVAGRKVYVEGEGPDADLQALSDALSERGIDLAAMSNDEIVAALEAADGQSYNQDGTLKTDTPEFAAWFGDSKVVDENGKPLVVYHGTDRQFSGESFSAQESGRRDFGWWGRGFYFTAEPTAADAYSSDEDGQMGQVIPVYLNLRNPKIVRSSDQIAVSADESAKRRAKWMEEGFDGVIVKNDFGETWAEKEFWEVVAFRPEQIKSVYNRGTFDPNDPRILYQPAYHGSPHIFDKFSTDKIGTGEGAQAYGWGLYFAGRKGVAEYYRKSLTPNPGVEAGQFSTRLQYKGEVFSRVLAAHPEWASTDDSRAEIGRKVDNLTRSLWAHVEKQGAKPIVTVENWLAEQEKFSRGLMKPPYANVGDDLAIVEAMRDMPKPEWVEPKGRLYKVDIPEDSDLLAWDAPLSEQPEIHERVVAAIKSLIGPEFEELADLIEYSDDMTGADAYSWISNAFEKGFVPDGIFSRPGGKYDQYTSEILRDAGIPGHRYLDQGSRADGDGSYNYVIYDDAAVSVLEFEQGNRGSIVLPSGGLGNGQTVINLFESADLSTFLHESGHFFLEAFNALASDASAPQTMKNDMAAILDWFGVKDWSEVGVKHHEQWARGFEAYAMEGKAPSLALADAFSRFKAWLTRIYRSIAGLNVKITPEIREVMDRMLATDAEIKAAREEQAMRPLFAEAPPGMSQTDFTTYQRMARRAVDQAEQSLMARVMAKVRREREAWYRAEKKAVLAEVTADVERRREYRLVDLLANQVWHGAVDGAEIPDMQIDRKALVEQFGDGVLAEVSRQRFGGRRAIYGDNGAAPEEVAQFFGFASAAEMVRTLQNAPRKRDAIAAEVERRMVERHGDPLNDGTIEEEALAAIHSEQQANLSVAEARHMARRLGRDTAGMTAKIYRHRAREMVGRMMVRDVIRPERFLASERKAARAAQDAFATVARGTGKAEQALAEALQAKEQQILNGFIYDEARKVAEYVQKSREKMRAYSKKSVREKLDGGYIEQIDAILEDYDFRIRGQRQIARAESLKTFVDRMIEEGREGELNVDARLIDAVNRRHYTKLSVDEMRGLFDTVANIDHMGRFKQRLADRKRKRELQASADHVSGLIRKNLGTGKAGERHRIAEAFNLLWRTDTLLIRMDGGEELGGAYDEIKRSIDEATSEEHRMNVEMAERLDALFKSHYSAADIRRMKSERDIPGANDRAWSKLEILAVALNTGNEDNYLRLIAPDAAMKNRLTKAQVDVLLATMDENDWRFVQAMWDMVDSYWSGLAEVAQRRTGVVPKKVEAKLMVSAPSFVTGGYYPIVYDPALSASAAADEASAWDKFTATGRGATAAIRNGMTKQRAKSGGGRTLRLDVSVAFAHMRDTIRYIALSEAVDNTYRLVSHPDVQNAFLEAGAKDQHDILKLWLKDVAKGPSPSPDAFNTMFRIIKNNFTLSRLALNFKTVALQVTGVGQSAVVIGKRNMIRGYLEYLKSPRGTAAAVVARSVFMRERRSTFQKDIHDFMDDTQLAGPVASGYKKGKAVVGKIGFAPIVWTQFWAVDMPTWLGAFRAGVEKFGDESKAAHYADRMVARSQDSGLMADRAAFERGTLSETTRQADVVRFFTTLGGYMLTKMNRSYVETMRARIGWRDADAGAQRVGVVLTAATNLALLYWTEAILTALLWYALSDDDDDDDLKGFLLRETGSAVVGGIPIIRDAYSALMGYGGGGIYGSVADAPARLLTQVAQGENDAALRRAIADSVGMITGLPTTGPMRAIEGALSEDVPLSEALLGRNPLAR